jgi:hypothetical protein
VVGVPLPLTETGCFFPSQAGIGYLVTSIVLFKGSILFILSFPLLAVFLGFHIHISNTVFEVSEDLLALAEPPGFNF